MILPGTGYILTTDVLWDRDCDVIIVDNQPKRISVCAVFFQMSVLITRYKYPGKYLTDRVLFCCVDFLPERQLTSPW